MNFENKLLNKLLDKYERSKISKDKAKIIRDISLKFSDAIFDGHRNYDQEFEIALKAFEINKFAFPKYSRDGLFTELVLNIETDSIEKLYKYLKRVNPNNILAEYKAELEKSAKNGCEIVNNFANAMLTAIEDKNLSKINTYFESKDELNDIVLAINEMSRLDEEITERVFCAKHFSNSKRFIKIRNKISKIIREFADEPFDEEDDVVARMGVIKNTTYAFLKGNVIIEINGQIIDLKKYKEPLALSDAAIKKMFIVNCEAKTLVSVENFTSFELFNDPNSVVVYLGGFHNKVKRTLIDKIYKNTFIECFHYGDIDAGGFYIINHLREKTKISFKPLCMGIQELKKYRANAKPLTCNDVKRLEKMKDDIKFLEFKNVIEFMLINNIKLEQEAEE